MAGRLRPAGFLEYRSVNPAICRSTPIDIGKSGLQPLFKEAHMLSTSLYLHFPFHQDRRLTFICRRVDIAEEAV